jgi:valine--pyruvate aminotransferase
MEEGWAHRDECIRVSYAQDSASVKQGIGIIAEEVALAYGM